MVVTVPQFCPHRWLPSDVLLVRGLCLNNNLEPLP
jgi:hypothetical protein